MPGVVYVISYCVRLYHPRPTRQQLINPNGILMSVTKTVMNVNLTANILALRAKLL